MPSQLLRNFPEPPRPQPTGRMMVVFRSETDTTKIQDTLSKSAGVRTHDRREFAGAATALNETLNAGEAVMFHRQKLAIVANRDVQANTFSIDDNVQFVRPEFYMFAIGELQRRYAEWVQQGLLMLVEQSGSPLPVGSNFQAAAVSAPFADDNLMTWGLQAIGIPSSRFTGKGINVAVLDTGVDLLHPDVVGRSITTKSFIQGVDVQDAQGHGTHTSGTIAGPKQSKIGRRYGVAPDVNLYVGKVLNNSGAGTETDIIDGMNWAIDEKCVAISMSLGRPTAVNEAVDPIYERTGAAALQENCLIIAAAGNESARNFGYIAPVGAPANSPSIMAVAAVDPTMNVAPFSCGGISAGCNVDISGPGVSVYSSFLIPQQSKLLQGTSMACPHVAGLAALWAESDASLRGKKLWDALVGATRKLGIPRDYGNGLGQVPDAGPGIGV